MARVSGKETEVFSEVLAQVCLAYSIKKNQALTYDKFLENKYFSKDVLSAINTYCVFHSTVNSWMNGRKNATVNKFIQFASDNAAPNLKWVDAQGSAMYELKIKFKIASRHKIYNDKVFEGASSFNPYDSFKKNITGVSTDKWNPADIWVLNTTGINRIKKINKEARSLAQVNQALMDEFSKKNIVPISLKKPGRTVHFDIVNSNEYITRLVLEKTNNPIIEYTTGNKDVKINFSIETVKLNKGINAQQAQTNPYKAGIGKAIPGTQKHIRLKYHVDNKKLELEYTQSKGSSYAQAKMGNIGAANFQKIINQTSLSGVQKLNNLQRKHKEIDLKTDPWFNGQQFGVAKARKDVAKINPHKELLKEYVADIWKALNGSNSDFLNDKSMHDSSTLWSKARAGELGMAVGAIPNESIKKRVITNLFMAAASIAYVTGLAGRKEINYEKELGLKPQKLRSEFNASVYVKVY